MQISIADNGVGLKASAGRTTSTGLKVLLQTIHLLKENKKVKIGFRIHEQSDTNRQSVGTSVDIRIPLQFEYSIHS